MRYSRTLLTYCHHFNAAVAGTPDGVLGSESIFFLTYHEIRNTLISRRSAVFSHRDRSSQQRNRVTMMLVLVFRIGFTKFAVDAGDREQPRIVVRPT